MVSTLEVPYPSQRDAEVVYAALVVDREHKEDLLTRQMEVKDNLLRVWVSSSSRTLGATLKAVYLSFRTFSATDNRVLRTSLNFFMELLILVTKTLKTFG